MDPVWTSWIPGMVPDTLISQPGVDHAHLDWRRCTNINKLLLTTGINTICDIIMLGFECFVFFLSTKSPRKTV